MVDFHEEFVASIQDDYRVHTFVVHVPTLGAEETDVPGAMALLDGPRVTHYWDGTGDIGWGYSETLGLGDVYGWDVWMLYPHRVTWMGAPPEPAYWQHQLRTDQGESYDPRAFAAEVNRYADSVSR